MNGQVACVCLCVCVRKEVIFVQVVFVYSILNQSAMMLHVVGKGSIHSTEIGFWGGKQKSIIHLSLSIAVNIPLPSRQKDIHPPNDINYIAGT